MEALGLYLVSKYKHETWLNNYQSEMMRLAAAGNVKEPEKLPRYFDLKGPAAAGAGEKSGEEILRELAFD